MLIKYELRTRQISREDLPRLMLRTRILHGFRLRISLTEGLCGHAADALYFNGSVGIIRSAFRNLVYHIHPLDHFAESGISAVKVRACLMHDKELAACGIRMHGSCHGQHALSVF